MACDTATAVVPDPLLCEAVVFPYEVVVPHWNHAVVELPLGFTVPLSVAPVVLIPVAEVVVTAGGAAGVLKVASEPLNVAAQFCATIRK